MPGTEYDDVYGSSLSASVEDRDMCVSPGTMAQFTFYRRASEEDGRRPHLDSITESDVIRDMDYVMDQMDIDDEVTAVPVRQLAAKSKSDMTDLKSVREVLDHMSELQDMRESECQLKPLLEAKKVTRSFGKRQVSNRSTTFLRLGGQPVRRKSWFIPVAAHMRQYAKSQSYWFDFPAPPVRFALNAKVKGSV